jgi:CubicO group peptidase (beta-lactamase class C family)
MRAALPCELDDPVATYWPAYASRGKGDITIGHVLTHRAGVPFASGSEFGDALTMTRWDTAVRQAQGARPRWPYGQVVAYHAMTYGFILGEVIRRVTGRRHCYHGE